MITTCIVLCFLLVFIPALRAGIKIEVINK